MKPVYLVFKTDYNHTHQSRELIGIATNTDIVLRIIKERVKKDGGKLPAEQIELLKTIKQTQCGSTDADQYSGEFLYELQPVNELI